MLERYHRLLSINIYLYIGIIYVHKTHTQVVLSTSLFTGVKRKKTENKWLFTYRVICFKTTSMTLMCMCVSSVNCTFYLYTYLSHCFLIDLSRIHKSIQKCVCTCTSTTNSNNILKTSCKKYAHVFFWISNSNVRIFKVNKLIFSNLISVTNSYTLKHIQLNRFFM